MELLFTIIQQIRLYIPTKCIIPKSKLKIEKLKAQTEHE